MYNETESDTHTHISDVLKLYGNLPNVSDTGAPRRRLLFLMPNVVFSYIDRATFLAYSANGSMIFAMYFQSDIVIFEF